MTKKKIQQYYFKNLNGDVRFDPKIQLEHPINKYYILEMLNALLKKDFDKVLDVGCGTGVYYPLLSKRVGQLVGLDISKNMLGFGKKQADSSGLNNVTFVLGDAKDMPFPDNSLDLVFCFDFHHHPPNVEAAIEPNPKNPTIFFLHLLFPLERGIFRTFPHLVRPEFEKYGDSVNLEYVRYIFFTKIRLLLHNTREESPTIRLIDNYLQ